MYIKNPYSNSPIYISNSNLVSFGKLAREIAKYDDEGMCLPRLFEEEGNKYVCIRIVMVSKRIIKPTKIHTLF